MYESNVTIYIICIVICIIYVHDDVNVFVNGYVNLCVDGCVNVLVDRYMYV